MTADLPSPGAPSLEASSIEAGPPSITADALDKTFITGKTRVAALNQVGLAIYAGELTMLLGASGSGKSTLLAAISGLLRPDNGVVTALGRDLWSLPAAEIERFRLDACGFIFQGFNLFTALTALEQVQVVLEYAGVRSRQARRRAASALEEVGLGGRLDLRPAELSGGEKQRVAIARAIAKAPQLLFADEPTSALDSQNGQIVIGLLHKAARDHGATVLCVTHDPRLLGHAERIIRMEDGRLVADERPQPAALRKKAAP